MLLAPLHIYGDTVDIPSLLPSPVRIEFGDEIDRIRRMVAVTGQTVGAIDEVTGLPQLESLRFYQRDHSPRRGTATREEWTCARCHS